MQYSEHAEKNPPRLIQYDIHGRRVDCIDYSINYHLLMKHSLESGCAGYGYKHQTELGLGSHVARAGLIYMANQLEPGHCCPVVMTAAAIPVLNNSVGHGSGSSGGGTGDGTGSSSGSSGGSVNKFHTGDSYEDWGEKLIHHSYDPRDVPISEKTGVTVGMSMTEKQGKCGVTALKRPLDTPIL